MKRAPHSGNSSDIPVCVDGVKIIASVKIKVATGDSKEALRTAVPPPPPPHALYQENRWNHDFTTLCDHHPSQGNDVLLESSHLKVALTEALKKDPMTNFKSLIIKKKTNLQ